jgi:hypothetical protein
MVIRVRRLDVAIEAGDFAGSLGWPDWEQRQGEREGGNASAGGYRELDHNKFP